MGNYEEIKHECGHHKSRSNLYDKAKNAILFNGSSRDCLGITVGVRKGCLFSIVLFNRENHL